MRNLMRGVLAAAVVFTSAGAARAAEAPDQFKAWGTLGKEIKWRIMPKRQADKMKADGKTAAQIEFQRKSYDARHWPEVQLEAEKPKTGFTRAEKQQGYVLFARHYMDRVYYYTIPRADERISELRAFAAQGEFEPVTFGIHALRGLDAVKVTVSDLGGRGGAVLPATQLDVRVVRCYPTPYGRPWWDPDSRDPKTKLPRKRMIPVPLEKRPAVAVPKGQTRQFWITLKVPEKCRPGVYRGTVNLSVNGQHRTVPLAVRVLPFPLLRPDKAAYMSGVKIEKDALIDYREHGFNVIGMGINLPRAQNRAVRAAFKKFMDTKDKNIQPPLPSAQKVFELNRDKIDAALGVAKEAGLDVRTVKFGFWTWFICGWTGKWFRYFPITPELDAKYVGVVNRVIAYAKNRGFPEFVVVPGDEPGGHPETLDDILHYLKLIKEKCPGARTGMTVGGGMSMGMDEVGKLGPHLDVVNTNYLDRKNLLRIRKAGKELWIYNCGSMTEDPQRDRYGYGFYMWKVDADGMLQWVYRWGDTYRMAYRGLPDLAAYVFESVEGKPLPTIHWEAMREGLDDQRYGATLTRLIEIAEKSGKAREAAHAKAVIKDVLSNFDVDYMRRRFPHNLKRAFYVDSLDAPAFDKFRWRLAVEIINLQKALGPKAVLNAKDKARPFAPALDASK